MPGNLLPLLLVAGGAAVVMGKKKKKKAPVSGYTSVDIPSPPSVQTKGPSGAEASRKIWAGRQKALAYLTGIGFCDCDPGAIDGTYGPATQTALKTFQFVTGVATKEFGTWGPHTEKQMGETLAKATMGLVKLPKEKLSARSNEIIISKDGLRYGIGVQFRYQTLEPLLEEKWGVMGFGYRKEVEYLKGQFMTPVFVFDRTERELNDVLGYLMRRIVIHPAANGFAGVGVVPLADLSPSPAKAAVVDKIRNWTFTFVKSKIAELNEMVSG